MSAGRRPLPRSGRLLSAAALPRPTSWARERIAAAGGDVVDYGSPEWEALADEDPRKLAAALVYAELARFEELTRVQRLQAELDEMRYERESEELADAVEAGARDAVKRTERIEAGCARLAEHGAAQLQGQRATAAQLAVRQGDVARAARIDRQRDRAAAVPTVQELMRRPIGTAVVD